MFVYLASVVCAYVGVVFVFCVFAGWVEICKHSQCIGRHDLPKFWQKLDAENASRLLSVLRECAGWVLKYINISVCWKA